MELSSARGVVPRESPEPALIGLHQSRQPAAGNLVENGQDSGSLEVRPYRRDEILVCSGPELAMFLPEIRHELSLGQDYLGKDEPTYWSALLQESTLHGLGDESIEIVLEKQIGQIPSVRRLVGQEIPQVVRSVE